MTFDIPHMIATGLLIFAILWIRNHVDYFRDMTKARRTLVQFVMLFIVLLILNIVWPYGSRA